MQKVLLIEMPAVSDEEQIYIYQKNVIIYTKSQ